MKVYDYVTLGDGDFTYSLDLCRFLRVETSVNEYRRQNDIMSATSSLDEGVGRRIEVFCTGIDSRDDLSKYADIDNTLQRINELGGPIPMLYKSGNEPTYKSGNEPTHETSTSSCLPSMNIHIHHCVNAIQSNDHTDLKSNPTIPLGIRFKQVIFNHPHLGVEDAVKHSRFLSHLFHSADRHWLSVKPNAGVFHLTLVKGQFERWKCKDAAEKHGFVVLNRMPFNPPPPPGKYIDYVLKPDTEERSNSSERSVKKHRPSFVMNTKLFQSKDDYQSRFQHRRHQSGRSFASRAEGGSETITLGRKDDHGFYLVTSLSWQNFKLYEEKLQCPHCDKSFNDNRALKNHIKCVHDDSRAKVTFTCALCYDNKRIFTSKEALDAHKKAKHGKYSIVKPDWAKDEVTNCNDTHKTATNEAIDYCKICEVRFFNEADKLKHLEEFIPTITMKSKQTIFKCSKCQKLLHDRRAQQQHEIFCQK